MPMVPVTLPSVWTVPVAAGVPVLLGQSVTHGVQAAASVSIGTVLDDFLISQAAGQWGIFNSAGQSVLSAARVLSVSGESEQHIATAPLEDGSFLSYSKVASPRTHRVLMVCDGSETGLDAQSLSALLPKPVSTLAGGGGLYVRKAFFATLAALEADLSLYSVITPERKYKNVNITGYRWLRDARHGITMPVVEITLQEVRLSATENFITTQRPQGQRMVCGGVVPAQSSSTMFFTRSLYDSTQTAGTPHNTTSWNSLAGSPL